MWGCFCTLQSLRQNPIPYRVVYTKDLRERLCISRFSHQNYMKLKRFLKKVGRAAGFDVSSLPRVRGIPYAELYQPVYSPWRSEAFLAEYARVSPYTLVSDDKCYLLAALATQSSQLDGEVWECGVYQGGTAMLLAGRLSAAGKTLRLFDTFEGMPETDAAKDLHKGGDFSNTSLDSVRSRVRGDFVHFHKGLIPETFSGLESARIAFAHVDVDIYSSIRACCEFIFPRLCVGGVMIIDDYGFYRCPGARSAVDEYFSGRTTIPVALPTGQALVMKSVA